MTETETERDRDRDRDRERHEVRYAEATSNVGKRKESYHVCSIYLDKGHDGQPHLKGEKWKSTTKTKASHAREMRLERESM